MEKIAAPPNPRLAHLARLKALQVKRSRTPAEVAELLDLLAARVLELENRLGD